MNTPKLDKHPGDRPHPDEKKRTNIEMPADEEVPRRTSEDERYARGETPRERYAEAGTPPRDETYRPREERYGHRETHPRDERYVDTMAPYRSDAGRALGDAGNNVKTGIAGSLRGIDEVESEVVTVLRNTLSNTLRATGAVGTEAVDVTRTTVNAAAQGIGDIGTTAVTSVRDILLSIVEGVKDVAGAAMPRSYHAANNRTPPEDRVPPERYATPPDRPRQPEYVPADNNERV